MTDKELDLIYRALKAIAVTISDLDLSVKELTKLLNEGCIDVHLVK